MLIVTLGLKAQTDIFDEPWRWAHFTTESGLPSNNVLDVIETPDSTLWAVCDAGLAWYDGFQWQSVQFPSSLRWTVNSISSDYRVDSIIVSLGDSAGVSFKDYIGNKSGFSELPIPYFQSVVFFSGDTILVRKNFSLFRLKGGVLHPFEASQELTRGKVKKILRTKTGKVWMTTKDGVLKWEDNDWRFVLQTHGELPEPVTIAENSKGTAIINVEAPPTWLGLWQWSPRSHAAHRIPKTPEGTHAVAIDPDGQIIVTCYSGETRLRSGGIWKTCSMLQDRSKHMHDLFFRRNGDLVIATTDGIQYFNASSPRWRVLRYGSPDDWEAVNEILTTRRGEIWLGTANGIAVCGKDGSKRFIRRIGSVPITSVTGLEEDGDGNVWVSSGSAFGGAYRWDGTTWQHFQIAADSDEARFHKIRKDRQGRLWFLGLSKFGELPGARPPGAFVYENNRFTHWGTNEGLPHEQVYAFAEDPEGALWFGTHGGLSKWKDGHWQHWTTVQGLHADHVFTLAIDQQRKVWFGQQVYGLGLGCIDSSGKVKYFTKSEGLVNDNVWDVRVDSQDVVWIATDGGLAKYDHGVFSRFDEQTGLNDNLLWPVLPLKDEVYVGTRGQGVAILDRKESHRPLPRIVIGKPIIEDRDVHLNWRAYSYWGGIFPTEILTRYRIDGGQWSNWNKVREIKTANLSSGDHALIVQAKGLFGDYDLVGQHATFTVPLPLYLQPKVAVPATVLVFGLIVLGSVLVVRKRRYDSDLRQREAKFRAVTEMTYSAIFIYKDDLSVIFSNSGMESLTGYSQEELHKMKITDLLSVEHRERFLSIETVRRVDTSVPQRTEFKVLKKDGTERWIDLSWGSMMFQGMPATLGTAFDITERKHAEMRIRTLASELSSTEQKSRRRMAAFLHDTIGQALALSKMKVEALLQTSQQPAVQRSAEEVHALLRDAIQTTRSFTFDLSPPILYDLGLVPAIDWLIEELQKQQKISISLHNPISKFRLADDVRNVLFEGTKELLINSVKHGRAKIIDVSIIHQDSMVTIAVHDDGVGFDVSKIDQLQTAHKSFGLFNLKERLKDISGRMEIESSPGTGTTVRLHAPTLTQEGTSQ